MLLLRPLLPINPKFGVCAVFTVDPNGDDEPNVEEAALFVIGLPIGFIGFTLALNAGAGVAA